MRPLALVSAVAAVVISASALQAATITVPISRATLIRNNGTVYAPEGSPAVGWFDDVTDFNANGGYSFRLPAIPVGDKVDSIVFHAGDASSWWVYNTLKNLPSDVYGVAISPTDTFSGSEYGSGTSQSGTKLSTNWFTGTVGALPNVDVTTWVTDTGYVAGNYVRLRTATSASEATINSNMARWWTSASAAQLIVTTSVVPEPATVALLGLGSLFIMRRRRA